MLYKIKEPTSGFTVTEIVTQDMKRISILMFITGQIRRSGMVLLPYIREFIFTAKTQ